MDHLIQLLARDQSSFTFKIHNYLDILDADISIYEYNFHRSVKSFELVFQSSVNIINSTLKLDQLLPAKYYKLVFDFKLKSGQSIQLVKHETTRSDIPQQQLNEQQQFYQSVQKTKVRNGLSQQEQFLDNYITSNDNQKMLLNARKCQDTKDFINSGYQFRRPVELHQQRKQRTLFTAKTSFALDGLYENDQEMREKQLKNEWFMGPFYKY